MKKETKLILGWHMNVNQEPKYWVSTDPKAGGHSPEHLVMVPSELIGSHTAIIAQSGSGKSFFLGRLIEEILVQTKARCIVFDPNADFRKAYEIEDESLWESAKFDRQTGLGKLSHEAHRSDFEKQWIPVRERTRIKMGGDGSLSIENYEPLQLSWSSLSVEFLAEEIDPMHRSDLYHCHTFAQDIETLFRVMGFADDKTPDDAMFDTERIFSETEKIFQQALPAHGSQHEFRSMFEERFNVDDVINKLFKEKSRRSEPAALFKEGSRLINVMRLFGFTVPRFIEQFPLDLISEMIKTYKDLLRSRIRSHLERILEAPKYVAPVVQHFYFSKAREYQIAGILQKNVSQRDSKSVTENRLEVIDLPSLRNKATTLLAISTILSMEWDHARREWSKALEKSPLKDERVPTFIVVDEAHNLIPSETPAKAEHALREQFRTIVAEGRKYGLYLILVSQRPDKLDSLVISECENKAVMKLSSTSVLKITKKMLGLDDVHPKLLEKSLEFKTGRALLIGRWVQDSPQLLYSAARRTIEGGRNLRADHWATPLQPPKRTRRGRRSKLSGSAEKRSRKSGRRTGGSARQK